MKIDLIHDHQTTKGASATIKGGPNRGPKLGSVVTIQGPDGSGIDLGVGDLLHIAHVVLTASDLQEPRDRRVEFVHAIKQMHVRKDRDSHGRRLHGPPPKV